MRGSVAAISVALCIAGCDGSAQSVAALNQDASYDILLAGGRVIDPESGLDGVRDVGILAGKVAAVAEGPLAGATTIDAGGLVVAPGFVNVHSHAWTPLGQQFEVMDGVTTALELEAGAYPVSDFGTFEPIAIADKPLINFGASVGHAFVRSAILEGGQGVSGLDHLLARALGGGSGAGMDTPAFRLPLSAPQREELRRRINEGLDAGGIGIGMLLDYMSEAVDAAEMRVVFAVAAAHGAPVIVHVRRGVAGDPAGLIEVIQHAKESGAQVHVCHVQANAMGAIHEFLRLIRQARGEGVKITTESFPYNAGSTSNTAAVFARDWQKIFAITYADVEWAATGERFDEAMWRDYRRNRPGGSVIHHYNREEWTSVATNAPDVILASDAMPIVSLERKVAPFGVGANARVLGRYVRKKGSLRLMDAIAKVAYLPARMLQDHSPGMALKGRIKEGADADITVFDPETVIDNATFRDPYQASSGIVHVIVGGRFVVRDGELQEGVHPGRRL